MIFNFSAEWPLSPGDVAWLRDGYFPSKLNDAIRQIRQVRAIDGYPFDPDRTSRFANNTPEVNVLLKSDNWTLPSGGAAGTFYDTGVSGIAPIPDMWINWNREFDPANNLYGRIVRHEFIHMLLWMQYPPMDGDLQRYTDEWLNSQHGRQAPGKDPFLLALNRQIVDYYPVSNASNPGALPA